MFWESRERGSMGEARVFSGLEADTVADELVL